MLWSHVSEAVEFKLRCSQLPGTEGSGLERRCGCWRWFLTQLILNLDINEIMCIFYNLWHNILKLLSMGCISRCLFWQLQRNLRLSQWTQSHIGQRGNILVFMQPSFQKWLSETFLTVIMFLAQDIRYLLSSRIYHRVRKAIFMDLKRTYWLNRRRIFIVSFESF